MMSDHRSKHQDIASLMDARTVEEVLDEAADFIDEEFTPVEKDAVPELARTVEDVRADFQNSDLRAGIEKLRWYATKSQMAYAITDELVERHLNVNEVPGAYKINTERITEIHLGMLAMYANLSKKLSVRKQSLKLAQAPSVMYKK